MSYWKHLSTIELEDNQVAAEITSEEDKLSPKKKSDSDKLVERAEQITDEKPLVTRLVRTVSLAALLMLSWVPFFQGKNEYSLPYYKLTPLRGEDRNSKMENSSHLGFQQVE
ncbi:hypothetical protein TSAR_008430 [Trichomalopsis sarcophagae]|uniref:Uncharacterized protein n=1 Tax=Trichomalopsis sarcophagae TaxID=543379 RepID=A0A232EEU0_9HYME|nr:hypothetical protein TSAR_008430 [Trichomalopsis sarcophagae]